MIILLEISASAIGAHAILNYIERIYKTLRNENYDLLIYLFRLLTRNRRKRYSDSIF